MIVNEKGEILEGSTIHRAPEDMQHRIFRVHKIENSNKRKTECSEQNNTVCSPKIMTHMKQAF